VLVDDGAMRMLVVKGAPEDVLRLSAHYEATETATVRAWDSAAREKAERQLEVLGTQGLRVLASPSSRSARTTTMPASATRRNLCSPVSQRFSIPQGERGESDRGARGERRSREDRDRRQRARDAAHLRETGLKVTGVLSGAEIAQLNDHALQARADTSISSAA
jgi:Mg2+-importing ATPase